MCRADGSFASGDLPFTLGDTQCIWGHTLYMGWHVLHAGPPALIFWGTISFTAVSEEQSPTMLSKRDTRGGTYRDFSTPLEIRIQKETCRESRQVSYTPYGIR